MARLSPLAASIFVAVGVVAAVAVLPFSNWSFRNQVDALKEPSWEWARHAPNTGVGSPKVDNAAWIRSRRDDSLGRAFAIFHRLTPTSFVPEDPYIERPWFVALEEHEKRFPKDVEGFAAHARLLCMSPMTKPATEIQPSGKRVRQQEAQRQIKQRTDVANKLLLVATEGKRLEPGNLFFSYCWMMALNVLGRFEEAREEAFRGAKLRRFEDYAIAEGDVLIRGVERIIGYRGEAFRTAALASIVLPHFASIKGTVSEMISRCPPEEELQLKWALYRMQYTMARESSTYIGILVGKAGMNLALAEQGEFHSAERDEDKREEERRRFYLDRAGQFAKSLAKANLLESDQDPVKKLEEVNRLQESGRVVVGAPSDYPLFEDMFRWPALASKFLVGLVGLLIAIPGLVPWSKRAPESFERARGALSIAFAGLFAAILTNIGNDSLADSVPILLTIPLLGLAAIQARDANLKIVAIAFPISVFLVTVSAGLLIGIAAAGLILALMGIVWLSGRWSWLASVVGLAVAGTCLFSLQSPGFSTMGFLIAVPLALVAGSFLLAFPARWVGHGAAIAILMVTVGYAYVVSRDVADNARLKRFNPQFVSEAAKVRERAGLPRLSQEISIRLKAR